MWGHHSLRVVGGAPPDSCGGPVKTLFVVTDAELKEKLVVKDAALRW